MTARLPDLRDPSEHPLVGLALEAARESLRAAGLAELDEAQLRSLLLARYAEYGKPGGLPQEPGMLFKVQALVNSRIMDANPGGVRSNRRTRSPRSSCSQSRIAPSAASTARTLPAVAPRWANVPVRPTSIALSPPAVTVYREL